MLLYIEQGGCAMQSSFLDRQLCAGDLCLVAPKLAFTLSGDPGSEALLVCFPVKSLNSVFTELLLSDNYLSAFFIHLQRDPDADAVLLFHTADDAALSNAFHLLEAEAASGLPYADIMVYVHLYSILIALVRGYTPANLSPAGSPDPSAVVSPILTYIQEHFATVSLAELSDHFSYSTRHLSRMLREGTGETFGMILTRLKMKKASDLLMNPKLSASQIAAMLGYTDLSTFYKAFKRTYRMNPSDFRKHAADQSITSSTGQ